MPSKVYICNLALGRIGKPVIRSFDDSSAQAGYCRTFWDHLRDEVLAAHAWGFAEKSVALADLGNPPPDWGYRYQLPVDCLRAIEVIPATRGMPPAPWKRIAAPDGASANVLTDQDQAWLRYTARIENPNAYTTEFAEAFAWRLAAEMALPLTKDKGLHQWAHEQYRVAMSKAEATDANQAQADAPADASWIQARS
ncbi:hypothetical protein [Marinobacterium jannaschii]|uniref:hypothetical protein n=1 Tax=Marinobacterium jannaschii TaxID=64970 RepID=UPI0006868192|nr:hypothetical protein [Marinobacterium jannaschii]